MSSYDFAFVHVKAADSLGEDGDYEAKRDFIEKIDRAAALFNDLPDDTLLIVTADHSTPWRLKSHSWHPVPICLVAESARVDACRTFGETSFLTGGLGRIHSTDVMPLLLAHARRLKKYGA